MLYWFPVGWKTCLFRCEAKQTRGGRNIVFHLAQMVRSCRWIRDMGLGLNFAQTHTYSFTLLSFCPISPSSITTSPFVQCLLISLSLPPHSSLSLLSKFFCHWPSTVRLVQKIAQDLVCVCVCVCVHHVSLHRGTDWRTGKIELVYYTFAPLREIPEA